MTNKERNNHLIIVTGLSGAGMSSCLKSLEDLGYEVLDNIPLFLVSSLKEDESGNRPLAIGIDTRTRDFDPHDVANTAKERGAHLLFVTCNADILQKRFSETRRKHPLAQDRAITDGIDMEQRLLVPLQEAADSIIDTSELSIHDLRRQIAQKFDIQTDKALSLTVMSFGFKHGVPREADIVMDVRFLKNPHWEETLRDLTGQEDAVGDYISQDSNWNRFIDNFQKLLDGLLEPYLQEGKSYLTIALGCTGGKHRSVFSAETIHRWLQERNITASIYHRDIER